MPLGIRDIGPDDGNFDMIEDPSTRSATSPGEPVITPKDGSIGSVSEDKLDHFNVSGDGKAVPVDDSGDTVRKRSLNLKKLVIYGVIGFVIYKLIKS